MPHRRQRFAAGFIGAAALLSILYAASFMASCATMNGVGLQAPAIAPNMQLVLDRHDRYVIADEARDPLDKELDLFASLAVRDAFARAGAPIPAPADIAPHLPVIANPGGGQ